MSLLINNRLIVFRGYGAGVWRYGQYLHLDIAPKCDFLNKNYRDFIFNQSTHGEHFFPVDKATVGECTGHLDTLHKMIFEGDLVKVSKPWNGIYEVKYINGIDTFGLQKQGSKNAFLEFIDISSSNVEIIGNIHNLK